MTQTAVRYARVLWELHMPPERVEETLDVFREEPRLMATLRDPQVHLEEKEAVIDRVFPEDMQNLLKVLCRNREVGAFEEIVEEYHAYANERSRVVNATLTYVTPPNEEQREGIRQFLLRTYGAEDVDLTERQDDSIIGGFILTAGDEEYDWSLKGRIHALGQRLTGGEDI